MLRRFILYILLVIQAALSHRLIAQANYQVANSLKLGTGYSENRVVCLYKDRTGFVWIGGAFGLYRYDGQRIINLNEMEGVSGRLPDGAVYTLAGDEANDLFIQTVNGLYKFSQRSGNLDLLVRNGDCVGKNTLIKPAQTGIAGDGKLWFVCAPSQTIYQVGSNGTLSAAVKMTSWNDDLNACYKTLEDSAEIYLVGLMQARILKKRRDGTFTGNFNTSELLSAKARVFCLANLSLTPDSSYLLLHATTSQLLVCQNKKNGKKNLLTDKTWFGFNDLESEVTGRFWISAVYGNGSTGLLLYDPLKYQFIALPPAIRELPSVNCFLSDNGGLLWMGTEKGVVLMHSDNGLFRNYMNDQHAAANDAPMSCRGMFQLNDSCLLLSTYKGNFLVNLETGTSNALTEQHPPLLYVIKRLKSNRVIAVNYHGVLHVYNENTNRFDTLPGAVFPSNVYSLCQDNQGSVWLAGFARLYQMLDDKPIELTASLNLDLQLTNIRQLTCVNDTLITVATNQGLLLLNPVTKSLRSLKYIWQQHKLPVPEIYQCYTDTPGSYWLATRYSGLQHVVSAGLKVETYGKSEGLNPGEVVSILPDGQGHLWLGTFNGLSCFDIRNKRFYNFLTADGLPNNEFNFSSALKLNNGNLAFGTINGFTVFNPALVFKSARFFAYPLVVTRLAVYDGKAKRFSTRQTGVEKPDKIELFPFDRFFELDVALLNYTKAAGHRFAYYLEGFDDTWIDNGQRSTIRYTSLPSGNYKLHIRAKDLRGTWDEELVIPVVVHEIFYNQFWFWLLCFFAMALVGYAFYRFRLNQLRKVHDVRMKIAADLHDEVGSTLTDIAVQAELAQMAAGSQQSAALERITLALQDAVGGMREVIWTVNAKNDNVGKLVAHMEEHLYETFTGKGVQVRFNATGVNKAKSIDGRARQHVYLIFKEALTNILKHSNATVVDVQLMVIGSKFELRIADNGTISQSKFAGNKLGLQSMKNRAAQIGAQLTIANTDGFVVIVTGQNIF